MFKNRKARRQSAVRHGLLLRVALKVVSRHVIHGDLDQVPSQTLAAEIIALAFGEQQMRITDPEALDYLNAALVDRGYPLRTATGTYPEGDQQ